MYTDGTTLAKIGKENARTLTCVCAHDTYHPGQARVLCQCLARISKKGDKLLSCEKAALRRCNPHQQQQQPYAATQQRSSSSSWWSIKARETFLQTVFLRLVDAVNNNPLLTERMQVRRAFVDSHKGGSTYVESSPLADKGIRSPVCLFCKQLSIRHATIPIQSYTCVSVSPPQARTRTRTWTMRRKSERATGCCCASGGRQPSSQNRKKTDSPNLHRPRVGWVK